ncbi:tyrosine-type recombinase/integrase [Spirosoma sp.]|uniref:tyrosine-type recombinase/integrase n=1 Tax=Spirosoma sp. TaxID=1899569 RepID=UPI003B3B2CC6
MKGVATVNLFFDKRATKDGLGVIKWSICYERKQRLFTTGIKTSVEEWNFLERNKAGLKGHVKNSDRRELWHKVYGNEFTGLNGQKQAGYLLRAQTVLNQLGDNFSFDRFAEAILDFGKQKEIPADRTDVIVALFLRANNMNKEGRVGNALNYETTAKSLQRFIDSFNDDERKEFLGIPVPRRVQNSRSSVSLQFRHLTSRFLTTYEQWMLQFGRVSRKPNKPPSPATITTVGIYLRHLRAVVNEAIESGVMARDAYPFGRNRYVIPAGTNTKKALPKADLELIKAYKPISGTMEQRSHDLWLFSYFCNGMNITDICSLTWGMVDLSAGTLRFIRQKTARSKKQNQTLVKAQLREETLAILERWSRAERKQSDFVFPFLSSDMDAVRRKSVVRQVVNVTNRWMRKIANVLGVESDVNTYAARHSFATILLKSNTPIGFISKSLGHTNLKTTESYLGSFDDDEAKIFLNAL